MEVILSSPRGFCAGVVRAIEVVEKSLAKFGTPIYVKHEIVHNPYVVQSLAEKGAKTVEDVDAIPTGSVVVFLPTDLLQRISLKLKHVILKS